MNVPMNSTNDNSVNLTVGAGAVKVDVRAEVGADPGAVERAMTPAWADFMNSLT